MAKINLIISMDWEGCDLLDKNLSSIKDFKRRWRCPITHYLNAGYYTNPNTMSDQVTDKIKSAVFEEDEQGMHLHAPRHFVESAGVGLRSSPTFSKYGDYNNGAEFGQEVMLHGYTRPELDALIGHSKSVLETKGFHSPKSFRAGGWMCDDKMIDSLAEHEFEIESSATVAGFLEGSSWENDNLQRYISLIWDGITPESSPYFIQASPTSKRSLLEIPNNLGAIDYWQESWIDELADRCVKNSKDKQEYLAVINSHQETFSEHVGKLSSFIEALSEKSGCSIEFTTNKEVLRSLKSA